MQPTKSTAHRTILRAAAMTLATVIISLPVANASDTQFGADAQSWGSTAPENPEVKAALDHAKGTKPLATAGAEKSQPGSWDSTAPENPEQQAAQRVTGKARQETGEPVGSAWDSTAPENPEQAKRG